MPRRPRDTNQLAKLAVDITTGQVEDDPVEPTGKAVGGHARAKSMTAERRKEIAKKGAAARWRSNGVRP